MRLYLLAAAIMLAGLHTAVAEEWMVEAHYPDQAALNRAASKFQHVIVDARRQTLRVDTDEAGIAALEDAGLSVSIDTAATARLRGFYATMQAAQQSGARRHTEGGYPSIPGFACYRTLEGTYQTMDDLAAAHSGLAEVRDIGPSWEKTQGIGGHEMRALRITNLATASADPDRPKLVAFGSIHAREYTPAELLTRMAEWLVAGYGIDPQATWLVDHVDFRFILQANPDGRKKAETGIEWRKNTNTVDGACPGTPDGGSQPGIDLNRNFPFHWNTTGGGGSSGFRCDQTYRGPIAGSEPETDNLVRYVAGTLAAGSYVGGALPDRRNGDLTGPAPEDYAGLFFDVHSYSQLVLWSWGDTSTPAPNDATLRTLGRRLAWFNDYEPKASVELYPTDGTTIDTFYGALGAPSYTIELGVDFFESCGSFVNSTLPINLAALTYAARAAQAPYRLPSGPDTIAVTAAPDLIALGSPVQVQARLDSSHFNNSHGTQTPQPIASAAAYIDLPPWAAGALPIPLSASDGAFDTMAEDAQGTLAGTLPSGRHLVYVQGTDDMGRAGTPDATFVEVAAAESIGQLSGAITARADGTPLVGTLTATNTTSGERRSAASDPADGRYVRTMYAGTVDVRASAQGYLDEELHEVVLDGGQSLTRNFKLLPACTLFSDDLESGGAAWSAQSPWVLSNTVPGNPTYVWNTPDYAPNLSRSLTLASAIDATGYAAVGIDFDDRCATEASFDHGNVEYSTNNGSTWTGVYSCSGRSTWQSNHIDLPTDVDDASALKIRFRLQSDPYVSDAGWAVDNIRITAGGQACRDQQVPDDDVIFADGFEP